MNVTKINNAQYQNFTGNYINTAKKAVCALAATSAILAATQNTKAQDIMWPAQPGDITFPVQPGSIPSEDWYSMYQRQIQQNGVLISTDAFGQRWVSSLDYANLQVKYDEFIKNNPLPSRTSRKLPQTPTGNSSKDLPSIESIKKQAEEEHKTTHNILTIGALILGFFFGPNLLAGIIRKVSK